MELAEGAAECPRCGAIFGVRNGWLPSLQRGVVRYTDNRAANRVLLTPVIRKVLKACFLATFSIVALMIPFLNLPFLLLATPILLLPWGREDIDNAFAMILVHSWSAIALFFVYFAAFWGWVDWYRERRRAQKDAQRHATPQQPRSPEPDLFISLITAVSPILLLAALVVPLGWVVILVAIGFAGNASYRGIRAFTFPWNAMFFVLGALYAVAVVSFLAALTYDLFR